jgi:hypothetical protein
MRNVYITERKTPSEDTERYGMNKFNTEIHKNFRKIPSRIFCEAEGLLNAVYKVLNNLVNGGNDMGCGKHVQNY